MQTDKRYLGCDADDMIVRSSMHPGWVYVMIFHGTMNPAAARDVARRLIEEADKVEQAALARAEGR